MKPCLLALIGFFILGAAVNTPIQAQPAENKDAPQILTTDLTRRQKVESSQIDVSFVIYDDDAITEVTIDGEKQSFIRANTLTINKRFQFKRGTNTVTVVATDEKGNSQTQKYLVAFGAELEEIPSPAQNQGKFGWKIVGNIQYNSDSNPNNDLGLPAGIDTGDISIEGQIADEEQADIQSVANLTAILSWGKLRGFAGYSQSTYSKDIYKPLNTKVILAGVSYAPQSSKSGFSARYLLLDINMGSEAYAQYHIVTGGYQFGRQNKEEGTTKNLFGLLYNYKIFADSNLDAGNTALLNWEYSNLDAEKLDYFKSILAYGNGNDGNIATEFTTFTMDFDWSNKWESGFLQGTGFGIHYKSYPNQEPLFSDAGDSRIDIPIRFSFNLGWAFSPDWSLLFNYDYKVNVSSKSPYYKTVLGAQLNGGF